MPRSSAQTRYVEATCCQAADLHRLLEDRQALTGRLVRGLSLDLRIAVLQERLGQGVRADGERAALGIDVEERGGLLAAERGEALPDLGQVAGHEQQMAHGVDTRRCFRGDDAAVAVGDHDGRLIARRQHFPDRGDVLDQPRSLRTGRLTRLAAARQGGRLAGDVPLGEQLSGPVPPPRPVLDACPMHENDSHHDLLVLFRSAVEQQ